MTTVAMPTTTSRRRALWALQILIGVFFVVASAAPKLLGEAYAVQIFVEIGAGDWFRYFVGAVELAGGIGLLVPRLAGLAALGLVGLMVGATYTQLTVFDAPAATVTPIILGVLVAGIAWVRRAEIAGVFGR
ncbi:MAG: DoxX family protein [Pseudonocardia sp.]|nr:DoxX family protein [Pseudonocardia sp.]